MLFASGTAAASLTVAWAAPVLADFDGDGFDGDELILPSIIVAATVAVGVVAWRAWRTGPRGGEQDRRDEGRP